MVVGGGVPIDPQLLSREELLALVADQTVLIGQLWAEIAELQRRLDQNSSNSSRPPSLGQPVPQADAEGVGNAAR
jgi:hypothetical protein